MTDKVEIDNPTTANEIRILLYEAEGIENILELDDYPLLSRNFSYSPKIKALAYITLSPDYYSHSVKRKFKTLYIYFLDSKENRLIFELPDTTYGKVEYVHGLADVGFSNDGSLLAFTTSDSLFLYDLKTRTIKNLFTRKKDPLDGVGGIWAYGNPRFSEDNTKILLDKYYYEGYGSLIYDLETRSIKDLPFSMYGSGEETIGWYKEKIVVRKKEGPERNPKTKIVLVEPDTLQEETILDIPESNEVRYRENIIKGENVYLATRRTVPSGQYVCDKLKPTEVQSEISSLYRLNIRTKELTTLLEADATDVGIGDIGMAIFAYNFYDFNERELLLVKLRYQDIWGTINLLDESNPNKLVQLKL